MTQGKLTPTQGDILRALAGATPRWRLTAGRRSPLLHAAQDA
jgi:hypothetical protein